MLGGLKKRL